MSDTYKELLKETVTLLYSVGVTPDRGNDGKLLAKIEAALFADSQINDGLPETPKLLVGFNPNMRASCPLCGHPDFNDCGCPADEQMAAMA